MTPVLLVHSSGFNVRQWRRLAESLRDYRVIAPDLLGYATPWPSGEPFHFRQDVEHLAAQLTEPAHVVGHSYGGFLALQLALAHPELVKSIAVYEPVAFGILDEHDDVDSVAAPTDDLEAWLARFVDWWNGPGAWAALAAPTKDAFRAVGWKVSQEVASLAADKTDAAGYGRIDVPTLLLAGEKTQPSELRVVRALATALPRASLMVFPGLGHMGPIVAPDLINAQIKTHIDSLSS